MPPTTKLLLPIVLAIASGCGPSSADVHGKVTYRGRPVVAGSVTVEGIDGRPVSGSIRPDGSFEIAGTVTGPARVAVASPDPSLGLPAPTLASGKAIKLPPKIRPAEWVPLPPQYRDVRTSGLSYSLAAGSNSIDVKLE